jgi:hypothetical protein
LQDRLDLFQGTRRKLNLYLANEFNVFLQYFDPDENAISRVLAILLDPEGVHGQGAVFLDQFLDMIGHPELCAVSGKARVRYQDPATWANGSGLIDITIDMGKFGVGIENKPWAGEQKDQVPRYLEHLRKRYAGFCLVFIDGRGCPPKSISIHEQQALDADGRFKMISYHRELKHWVDACARTSEADKIRWFLRDFASYIERRFVPLEAEGDN